MSGYAKLYSDIIASSIWEEDPDILKVWIALLALADSEGYVRGTPAWLAFRCKINPDRCLLALNKFESPDKCSRTQTAEGRRIKPVDNGWLILNYVYFRNSRGEFDQTTGQKQGKVYYAAEPKGKEIKIGFSRNPWARLKELQISRPRIRIVATEPGSFDTERLRHDQFSEFRKEGEWFIYSSEIVEHVKTLNEADTVATNTTTVATPAYAYVSVPEDRGVGEGGTFEDAMARVPIELSEKLNGHLDFARMVYDLWDSREGKDGAGIQVRFEKHLRKRWNSEGEQWRNHCHPAQKKVSIPNNTNPTNYLNP